MGIHESGEDYLETILILKNQNNSVRSIDIARYLSFSKPSVSRAMSILKSSGYITIDGQGYIELTDSGAQVADEIYRRHTVIANWLAQIGVDPDTADRDACRMEHVISRETFNKLHEHIEKEK